MEYLKVVKGEDLVYNLIKVIMYEAFFQELFPHKRFLPFQHLPILLFPLKNLTKF